jgi:dolichyl-phosphate-mannose--protein O-mannosyl transferase
MRVFTDAEKQQLQAKIKDEQERQRVLREIAQIESEKESNRRRGIISMALSYKYIMLGFLLFVLIGYVILLPPQDYSYHNYLGPITLLIVIFNHIAWNFTKRGWLSRVMKTIAWIWIVFVCVYLFWFFKTGPA